MRRFRVQHSRFWISASAFIYTDVLESNARIFRSVAQTYATDLSFANSLRYAAELCDEILAGVKANDKIKVSTAHKRYADHYDNTLRTMARIRNARLMA